MNPRRMRYVRPILAGVVGLIAALGLLDALAVRDGLTKSGALLEALPRSGSAVDLDAVDASLEQAGTHLAAASGRARSVPMRSIAAIPMIGASARKLQDITEAGGLAVEAAKVAAKGLRAFPVGSGLLAYGLEDGRLDLAPLVDARPELEAAARIAAQARLASERPRRGWVIGPIGRADAELSERLSDLEGALRSAADASVLIPSMFGDEGPRRYLVVVQNLGEARATGGLVGGFLLIRAEEGKISLEKVTSNIELKGIGVDVPMPSWYRKRYDRFASRRHWSNVNMEPDFRVTGPLIAGLFERTNEVKVDGVIATDPVGLQRLAKLSGPVRGPKGVTVSGNNLAKVVMSDAYTLFPGRDSGGPRKDFLVELTSLIYEKLIASADVDQLADAFGDAAGGRHLQMWSSFPREQAILERAGVAGGFPSGGSPFVGVFSQNAAANKMDYYMRRKIDVSAKVVSRQEMDVTAAIELRNTGPSKGPPRIVLGPNEGLSYPPGSNRSLLSIYVSLDARVGTVEVNGRVTPAGSERSPHAAISSLYVDIPPGESTVIEVHWTQPLDPAIRQSGRDLQFVVVSQPTPVPDVVNFALVAEGYTVVTPGNEVRSDRAVRGFKAWLRRSIIRRVVDAVSSL